VSSCVLERETTDDNIIVVRYGYLKCMPSVLQERCVRCWMCRYFTCFILHKCCFLPTCVLASSSWRLLSCRIIWAAFFSLKPWRYRIRDCKFDRHDIEPIKAFFICVMWYLVKIVCISCFGTLKPLKLHCLGGINGLLNAIASWHVEAAWWIFYISWETFGITYPWNRQLQSVHL